jgi:hypothetical protein
MTDADLEMLDRAFHFTMRRFVETGQAPHHIELAADLGVAVEDGRRLLHEVVEGGYNSAWFYPDTDYITSFAPFHNLPTPYRITIEGAQKWFAQ